MTIISFLGLQLRCKNVFCKRDLAVSKRERRERRMLYEYAEDSPWPVSQTPRRRQTWDQVPSSLDFHSLLSPDRNCFILIDMKTNVAFSGRDTLQVCFYGKTSYYIKCYYIKTYYIMCHY